MPKNKLQSEVDTLRAQVAELTAARESEKNDIEEKAAATHNKEEATSGAEAGQGSNAVTDEQKKSSKASAGKVATEKVPTADKPADEENSGNDIEHQFQELIDTIDTELKEASPATVLVVFAAGILLGRLLPR